jgi:hypothetical protein
MRPVQSFFQRSTAACGRRPVITARTSAPPSAVTPPTSANAGPIQLMPRNGNGRAIPATSSAEPADRGDAGRALQPGAVDAPPRMVFLAQLLDLMIEGRGEVCEREPATQEAARPRGHHRRSG